MFNGDLLRVYIPGFIYNVFNIIADKVNDDEMTSNDFFNAFLDIDQATPAIISEE